MQLEQQKHLTPLMARTKAEYLALTSVIGSDFLWGYWSVQYTDWNNFVFVHVDEKELKIHENLIMRIHSRSFPNAMCT